jgi:hypothetical protein
VTVYKDSITYSLAKAKQLRDEGLKVVVYPQPDKIGKQLKYAVMLGIPKVAIVGSNEQQSDLINLKDMLSGEQQLVSPPSKQRIKGDLPKRDWSQWERDIFVEFAAIAKLELEPESVKSEKYPLPDLSCRIGGRQYYFEVKEVTDKRKLLREISDIKLKSYFAPSGYLELLICYTSEEKPHLAEMVQSLVELAKDMTELRRWHRLWIYDRHAKQILWTYSSDEI